MRSSYTALALLSFEASLHETTRKEHSKEEPASLSADDYAAIKLMEVFTIAILRKMKILCAAKA